MPVTRVALDPSPPSPAPKGRTASGIGMANLAARFLIEMAMYSSLGYSGASVAASLPVRATLAVLTPSAAMALWSRYLSPKARRRLTEPAALLAESLMFTAASIGLAVSGHVTLAIIFDVVAITNAVLLRAFAHKSKQRTASRTSR
jgi:Protein of unknown function (DUF2568)